MRWIESPTLHAPPLPGLQPLVARILQLCGITTTAAAQAFLDPAYYQPAPAGELPGVDLAVERILTHIRRHERICVWGDFDVDGQTATTLLVQLLKAMGADVTFHIPIREMEGHGVNVPQLKEVIASGSRLLLTCDTGISAQVAIDHATSSGIETVITDHHDLPQSLPNATAVVNPKMLPPDHPLAALSGVGVAFKLAEALIKEGQVAFAASDLLDLVAIGLVGDVALLQKDTRYLVQQGLAALRTTRRLGLQLLMESADLVPANLTEEHIGFSLAPRLNALGRLGDANPAVELLTTSNPSRARVLAAQLENYNLQRQLLASQVTRAAEAQLKADPALLDAPILIVGHASWPGGIVGLAAARLVERYGKPAIVLSMPPGGPVHGSARSVEDFHITQAISAQADLLIAYGGHPMAAGLSLLPENLPAFKNRLMKTAGRMVTTSQKEPSLELLAWLTLPELTLDLASMLEPLAPFGAGNRKTHFCLSQSFFEERCSNRPKQGTPEADCGGWIRQLATSPLVEWRR